MSLLPTVEITLDTTPPNVRVLAPDRITPPDDWVVTVVSGEAMVFASFAFIDSFGTERSVGYVQPTPQSIVVTVPSTAVSGGPGTLRGWVSDAVLNRADVLAVVDVDRDEAFSAVVTMSHAFGVSEGTTTGFDVVTSMEGGFDVDESPDHAFDVVLTVGPAFDAQETMSR